MYLLQAHKADVVDGRVDDRPLIWTDLGEFVEPRGCPVAGEHFALGRSSVPHDLSFSDLDLFLPLERNKTGCTLDLANIEGKSFDLETLATGYEYANEV